MVFLFIKHEGSDGPTLIGVGPGLATNTDSGTTDAEVIGGARNSSERRRHCVAVM